MRCSELHSRKLKPQTPRRLLSMRPATQALLKRRDGVDVESFQVNYGRHGHLVRPWCLANDVVYYAQVCNVPQERVDPD